MPGEASDDSPLSIAGVLAVRSFTFAPLEPITGMLADRYPRKTLMVVANLFSFVMLTSFIVLGLLDSLLSIYVLAMLLPSNMPWSEEEPGVSFWDWFAKVFSLRDSWELWYFMVGSTGFLDVPLVQEHEYVTAYPTKANSHPLMKHPHGVDERHGLRAQLLQQGAHLLAEQGGLCLREVAMLEELGEVALHVVEREQGAHLGHEAMQRLASGHGGEARR